MKIRRTPIKVALPQETPGNRVATQQRLAEEARNLFAADFCAVQAVNPITEILYADAVISGELPAETSPELIQEQLKSFADRVRTHQGTYLKHRPRLSKNLKVEPVLSKFATIAGVTFYTKREKKPMAVLLLGYRRRRTLRKIEKDILKLFTDQWLPVLENVWLLGRYREVVKIGQDINQTLKEPGELFEHLFARVSKILNTEYFFMLGIYHQPNKTMDYHLAYQGGIQHFQKSLDVELTEGNRYKSGYAYAIEKKTQLVEVHRSANPAAQIEFKSLIAPEDPDPESLIFVPLVFREEPLGVLSIQHLDAQAFDDEDVHILSLLANQVALAISDLRLFSYLEGLNEAGQQLTREISSDTMLDRVVDLIRGATKADIVTLYPYVQNSEVPLEERFGDPSASGSFLQEGTIRKAVREDDIAWLALQQDEPVWAEDSATLFQKLTHDSYPRKGNFEIRENIVSTAVLSLRVEGESVGILFVNYRNSQDFKAPQRNFISGLANFAAIAIYNNRRFKDVYTHRLAELEAFRQIDIDISKSLILRDVLQTILTTASETIKADSASIYLLQPHTQLLETEVSFGEEKERFERDKVPIHGPGIVPWVYREKRAVRVDNVKTDPQWRDIYHQVLEATTSELDVPLVKDDNEVVGVISFESKKESAFSEGDETFLVTLAGQAILAINEARLYEEAEEGRRSLAVLHVVTKEIIAQRGDPEKVIRFILSQARHLIGAEGALFQQYDDGSPSKFYVDSSHEETQNSLIALPGGYELGIVKHVAGTKRPYTTIGVDAQEDFFYRGSTVIHSETAVPLLTEEGDLVGVLDLESPRIFAFDEGDERVLGLFGELAVVAMKNARDYNRATDEAKRFQLLSATGSELAEIIEPDDLPSAYEIAITKVGEICTGEVVIRRIEPVTEDLIRVATGRERTFTPVERIKKGEGLNGQAAKDLKTILVPDLDNPPAGVAQSVSDDQSIKTIVVAPLLFEKSYYGNLVVSAERPFSLGSADVSLLEGLAKQLAITIHRLETIRAKQEVEEHARNMQVMGEVGHSAMEMAHRLSQDLKPVDVYVARIRKIMDEEEISHQMISQELDKVAKDVLAIINMARGMRTKITSLENFGHERSVIPVKALLDETDPSLYSPQNLEIAHELQDDLPNVFVDPGQVIDILRNLFTNSVEAMPEGGRIIIRASYVHGKGNQFVVVEVEDNGRGIKDEDQPKVFKLFFSTKASSGFGLWSSKQYAKANGGDLILKSKIGVGTTFTLTLPVATDKDGKQ